MKSFSTGHNTLAEHLAAYSTRFDLDSVPNAVVAYAGYLFLDLLGAAQAGVDNPEGAAAGKADALLSPAVVLALCGGQVVPHHQQLLRFITA